MNFIVNYMVAQNMAVKRFGNTKYGVLITRKNIVIEK